MANELCVYELDECDYVAAKNVEQAVVWYREYTGVIATEIVTHALRERLSFKDQEQQSSIVVSFDELIKKHKADGGGFPCVICTDGHYV